MNIKAGTIVNNRYRIIEKIGIGGMAVVYRARDEKLDRFVTFKVLKEEFAADAEFIKKFNIEARAAARLSHQNIVSVYDVGNEGYIHYIVMEYIDGFTLKELINKKAPFANEEALGVAIQIASALEHAHKNNIVHRDIKPQNILVTKDGTIKVTDFGIARAATSATVNVESMGSVHYFSPEQARGGFVDNKSDIYSLGIILFEMVTGRLPFDGDSTVSLALKHMNEPIPDIRNLNPDVSDSVLQIVLKATEKSSVQRYQDAVEMNNDLKKALTDVTGSFVNRTDSSYADSPTIKITPQEIEEIKKAQANYDNYDGFDDGYDGYVNDYDIDPEYIEPDNAAGKISEGDEKYYKAKERKVVIAAIVTAVAIITLITSFGAYFINKKNNGEIKVPNFVGKTLEEAAATADGMEFYVNQSGEEYNDKYAEGLIINQDKDVGTSIKKGDYVYVVLSLGSDKFDVPDTTGIEIDEIYTKYPELKNADIKIEYVYDEDAEINTIIRQSPLSGSKISNGDKLTLYVSKGEEENTWTLVPNVTGVSEAEARKRLKDADLKIGNVVYASDDTVPAGMVIKQGIGAGEQVEKDYVVNIIVSNGKEKETTTEEPKEEKTTETTTQEVIESGEASDRTETLNIEYALPEGTHEVKIVKITDSNSQEVIHQDTYSEGSFKYSKSETGNKPTVYQIWIDGELKGEKTLFQ